MYYPTLSRWLLRSAAVAVSSSSSCAFRGVNVVTSSFALPTTSQNTKRNSSRSSSGGGSSRNPMTSSSSSKTAVAATAAKQNSNELVPLIDVDCNLWHKDLSSLQSSSSSNKNDDDPAAVDKEQQPSFVSLLQEDAVAEANIVAMLSPSSTLTEARYGIQVLSTLAAAASTTATKSDEKRKQLGGLPQILTTVGIHPYHVNDDELVNSATDKEAVISQTMASMKELILEHYPQHVCAVGECGLDASPGFPQLDDQIPWFRAQVLLAHQFNPPLPLFVHERLAFAETMEILHQEYSNSTTPPPVIIHCFTGTRQECKAYVERGYYLSVSGYILKNNNNNNNNDDDNGADEVRACLHEGLIPLDRLMIETDAPYMGFEYCRQHYLSKNQDYVASLNSKKRKRLQNSIYPNVPSSLSIVLQEVVGVLNQGRQERAEEILSRDEVARITTKNAIQFFGFQGIDLE